MIKTQLNTRNDRKQQRRWTVICYQKAAKSYQCFEVKIMTIKEFEKTVEIIASLIIAYAILRLKEQPESISDWMMLFAGIVIVLLANWSYRRRKAKGRQ